MDNLVIGTKSFTSRLFLGTGKYSDNQIMLKSINLSKTQLVTVAMKRIDVSSDDNISSVLDDEKLLVLPNTSGAINAKEAVLLAELAFEAGMKKWVKLEIHPDQKYLLPDPIETLKANKILVDKGFCVMPYINADPVLAKRLEDDGAACVMPLAAPIGSNQGIKNENMLKIIIEQASIPVVIDAGLGLPSHACSAMELGADAVLVNTAIATAQDPLLMSDAFRISVEAGRMAYMSKGRFSSQYARATSPLTSFL